MTKETKQFASCTICNYGPEVLSHIARLEKQEEPFDLYGSEETVNIKIARAEKRKRRIKIARWLLKIAGALIGTKIKLEEKK